MKKLFFSRFYFENFEGFLEVLRIFINEKNANFLGFLTCRRISDTTKNFKKKGIPNLNAMQIQKKGNFLSRISKVTKNRPSWNLDF